MSLSLFQITGDSISHAQIVDHDSPDCVTERAIFLLPIQSFLIRRNSAFVITIQKVLASLLQ